MTAQNIPQYLAIFALVLAPAAAASCDRHAPAGGAAPGLNPGPKRGDRIVIEQTAAEFFEARVLAVDGATLRVQAANGGEFRHVQSSDAYRLPPAPHTFAVGDAAICRSAPAHWEPCRIRRTEPKSIEATDDRGHVLHVGRADVLAPTSLTRLDLERHFEIAERRQAFLHAAAAAGRPRAPKGWRPEPNEHVLALHDSRWYSATIHEIDDDTLVVRWRADSRVSELSYDSVAPAPPYRRDLHGGDFALARPTSLSAPWQAVRVVSANADTVIVSNVDGERQSLRPTDVVPLGR